MKIAEAFQIVLDLARQNVIDARYMPEENKRQMNAIKMVEKIDPIMSEFIPRALKD